MTTDHAPTDIGPDPAFEAEVRAMLTRRSADIGPADVDPALPEGVRIALVQEHRRRHDPRRWLAAAAVVAVLAVAGALVATQGDAPPDDVRTAPPADTSPEAAPVTIPGLPAGLSTAHLASLWDPGADAADPDADAVAAAYLADRLGADVTVTQPVIDIGPVATVTWAWLPDQDGPDGTVHLEQRAGRWQVVAATAEETFDYGEARLEDGRLVGSVTNASTQLWGLELNPAAASVTVRKLAGLVLGEASDCTSPCETGAIYIAAPELARAGGSKMPVERGPIGEPLPAEPFRLQTVTVRDGAQITGGEEPQAVGDVVQTFSEIVFDPTVPPAEPQAAPDGDRPGHLSSLPLGVDPTTGPVRSIEAWGASPEAAADDLVGEAFGDAVTPNAPFGFEGSDPDGLWAAYRTSLVELDPAVWPEGDVDQVTGTVTVRRSNTGGWTAVALTNAALDLTRVRYHSDEGGLRGEVRATVPAPLRVTVRSTTGEELATADLTTSADSGPTPSVLALDDLLEVTDGQPLLLRVEAGAAPGQVGDLGEEGVPVVAVASVVLPGWSDATGGPATTTAGTDTTPPAAPDASAPTATTGPADDATAEDATAEEARIRRLPHTSLPIGPGELWRGSVAAWGETYGDAAEAFAWAAMNLPDVEVAVLAPEPSGEVEVRVALGGGHGEVPVRLRRDGDEWVILQVGTGAVTVAGDGLAHDLPAPGEDQGVFFFAVQPHGGIRPGWAVEGTEDLVDAAGWIAVLLDEGTVVAATGNPAPA